MNNSFVCLDANLVVSMLLDETDDSANRLWERWESEYRQPVAPVLLRYEVINAIHRYYRAKLLDLPAVQAAATALIALPIQWSSEMALHQRALILARRFALPAAYDAHYLALAEYLDVEFWTADQRLANSVRPALSWVHLLGE